jgi:hypothetical protein
MRRHPGARPPISGLPEIGSISAQVDYSRLGRRLVPIGDFDGPHPFFDADGRLL